MKLGAYAEYASLSEKAVITKIPKNFSYKEAAAILFGADTALHFLRKAKIKKGDKVLIYAASGGVGTAVIQLAKYFGAEVSGVCSESNFKFVKSLGADILIDYTKENFTKNGETYDIIYDTIGKISYSECRHSLKENGRFIANNASLKDYFNLIKTSMIGNKKVIAGVALETIENLDLIRELVVSKKLKVPIDKIYPLDKISDSHKYVDLGHKKGNVVIKIN